MRVKLHTPTFLTITPKSIGIIKTFEEKVSLILLHIFISITRIP